MQAAAIQHLELILLFLLIIVAALAVLARRLQIAYPIVLVIGGLILSFVPHLPRVSLNPNLIFLVVLPPLMFAGGYNTPWRDFRYNLVSILMLAFGLVGFTVLGVAIGSHLLLPGFDFRMGAVLGAVVAPTDAIAATTIARRLGLDRRITDVLEGESLVNDASGLLALQFAIGLVVTGQARSILSSIGEFAWLVAGGILAGVAIGWVLHQVSLRIADAPVEITLSLVTPYLAYIAGEEIHASGVLAAVVCGLYLGGKTSVTFSSNARLQGSAVWGTLEFLLNGLVFILIGLQLPFIYAAIRSISPGALFRDALLSTAFVIILRLVWMYPGAWIAFQIRTRLLHQHDRMPSSRQIFIVGWTGMRGVIGLAAAISIPTQVNGGAPFPQREVIIFLTFCIIFATLVLQGLSLPWLIRRLGLASGGSSEDEEEQEARRTIVQETIHFLSKRKERDDGAHAATYDDFLHHYRDRLALAATPAKEQEQQDREEAHFRRRLAGELRQVERESALRLRDQGKINDEVLRTIQRELDLMDARFES